MNIFRFTFQRIIVIGTAVALPVAFDMGLLVTIGLCGLILLFISINKPYYSLLIFILFVPLLSQYSLSFGSGAPDLTFNRIFFLLIALSLLINVFNKTIFFPKVGKTELLMSLFCIIGGISIFINYPFSDTFGVLLNFADYIIMPFLLFLFAKILFKEESHFRVLTVTAIALGFYLACTGIYEHFTHVDLFPADYPYGTPSYFLGLRNTEGVVRVNGPLRFPEAFGVISAMIALLISYNLDIEFNSGGLNIFVKVLTIITIIMLMAAIYFTMFRGVWLGAIIGLAIRFIVLRKTRIKIVVVSLVLLIGAGLGLQAIQSSEVFQRRVTNTDTIFNRIATYKSAFLMFVEDPVWGKGFNRYTVVSESNTQYSQRFKGVWSSTYPHNTYMSVLVEHGLFGLGVFGAILAALVISILRFWRLADDKYRGTVPIFLGIFFVFIIPSVTDDLATMPYINYLFYPILGIAASFYQSVHNGIAEAGTPIISL